MPTRIYKADQPSNRCLACRDGIARWEGLMQPLMQECPDCDAPVHVVIQPVTLGAQDPRLADGPLYLSQLAKYPGDPDAYVSGPHSWQRRIDQAKREGYRVLSNSEIADDRTPREIKRDARKGL